MQDTQAIAHLIPLVLSCITIYMTWAAGDKKAWAWGLGFANQVLWFVWIAVSGFWSFLPMNLVLSVVYVRNWRKWRRPVVDGEDLPPRLSGPLNSPDRGGASGPARQSFGILVSWPEEYRQGRNRFFQTAGSKAVQELMFFARTCAAVHAEGAKVDAVTLVERREGEPLVGWVLQSGLSEDLDFYPPDREAAMRREQRLDAGSTAVEVTAI